MTLTFTPETHEYRLDGMVIPSVTQIMTPLSQAKYGTVDQETLDAAAKKGSEVHEAIEFFELYGICEYSERAQPYVDAYMKWREQYKPQIIFIERATWHKSLLYAGTLDMMALVDGKRTLVDFKTTAQINDMLTTVQLEAYDRALESQGETVEQKAILHLKQDGTFTYKPYKKRDTQAWRTFSALLTIKDHIKKYGG